MVDGFLARLAEVDGTGHRVAGHADAQALAAELAGDATVTGWGVEGVGRPAPAAEAELSLVTADVGVAFSGAVGWAHTRERPRAAGLLPDRQIVLLAAEAIVPTLGEAIGRLAPLAANVVFTAGPSRTADIEQRMMLGVHAPRSLDVIVFG